MHASFLTSTLSLFTLLLICTFVYIFSKKIKFPYSVLLLITGIFLIPLQSVPFFSFINHFVLTPDILLYVFLPILLFESAYNVNYRQLTKNIKSITSLAVFGVIISAFCIGGALYYLFPLIGFEIPFLVCLLFGSLISATDPIAVLAIFKSAGAPRRLSMIFEGESLFNDGASVALFLIILGMIMTGEITSATYISGFVTFMTMIFGGLIFGIFMGITFSKLIGKIKNNELVEISLTMILAHATFLIAEAISHYVVIFGFELKISGIIATAVAGIILGNYGRYKISPKVEAHMNQFWHFFAFIADSLVFILLGLILSHEKVDFVTFIIPIFLVIIVVMISRAISVYTPLFIINKLKLEENIPMKWQHMLSWGSLRGALALMMVLMIPGPGNDGFEQVLAFEKSVGWAFEYHIKDFLIVITIGSIMFTLFIKATSIGLLMRKLGINKLHELEEFERYEGKVLAYLKMLEKLETLHQKHYLTSSEVISLRVKYETLLKSSIESLKELIKSQGKENGTDLIRRALSLHALGIEKQYLRDLFTYNEISEKSFKFILNKINRQIERLESGKPQLKEIAEEKVELDFLQKLISGFGENDTNFVDVYIRNRTKAIITRKVIKELKKLAEVDFGFDKEMFDEIIALYENFNHIANLKKDAIFEEHINEISVIEGKLADKSLLKQEENIINDLYAKEIITPKLYVKFMHEIEDEILKDVKSIG